MNVSHFLGAAGRPAGRVVLDRVRSRRRSGTEWTRAFAGYNEATLRLPAPMALDHPWRAVRLAARVRAPALYDGRDQIEHAENRHGDAREPESGWLLVHQAQRQTEETEEKADSAPNCVLGWRFPPPRPSGTSCLQPWPLLGSSLLTDRVKLIMGGQTCLALAGGGCEVRAAACTGSPGPARPPDRTSGGERGRPYFSPDAARRPLVDRSRPVCRVHPMDADQAPGPAVERSVRQGLDGRAVSRPLF
jgi:hypothetical protein